MQHLECTSTHWLETYTLLERFPKYKIYLKWEKIMIRQREQKTYQIILTKRWA
jgi:hypothetical protein